MAATKDDNNGPAPPNWNVLGIVIRIKLDDKNDIDTK